MPPKKLTSIRELTKGLAWLTWRSKAPKLTPNVVLFDTAESFLAVPNLNSTTQIRGDSQCNEPIPKESAD